ncbi:MAG: RpiB/LacA/LacB family sugar-phosphate isomerase [Candidatus Aenigmarchaeota archaeon]|nr:RpiB/LacA/LacB family sugar-phosphate isomerase [Candidatus Aenigmarchaeota archaeon]
MIIYLASDHAGYSLKEAVKKFLEEKNFRCVDVGPHSYDGNDDYPDFIIPAAEKASGHPDNRAVIFGGSGQGEAIAANKVKGVRAAVFYGGPEEIISLSRTHNDANVLSIGARFVSEESAIKAVELWLRTPFPGEERHGRRIGKIKEFEDR